MVAARWGIRLIGIVSTVILARLLVPADFGLVAMTMIVVGLAEVLFAYGTDTALIQNPLAGKEHFDTAWTIGIIQGILVTAVLLSAAPFAAAYFGDLRVADLLPVLSLSVVITSLNNIGVVAFRKELAFQKEFQFLVVSKLLTFTATISMAFVLHNYWALVIGQIVGAALGCIQSYLIHPYRPKLSLKVVREIWSFSQWMLLVNIFTYMLGKVDEIVVGGHTNGSTMGIYSVGSEIAEMPSTELAFPLARALLPGYALLKSDPARLKAAYLNVLGLVGTVAVATSLGLGAVAKHLVPILLGEKWLEAVPLIQWLATFGMLRAIYGGAGNLLVVQGQMRLMALLALAQLIAMFAAIAAGFSLAGVVGVAIAKVVASVGYFCVLFYTLTNVFPITLRDIAESLWRPALAGAAMVSGLQAIASFETTGHALNLVISIVAGALIYSTTLGCLWLAAGRPAGAESFLFNLIVRKKSRDANG